MQGCKHPGCDTAKVKALGYCSAHYTRISRGKDMNPPILKYGESDKSRFWEKVNKTDSCWLWTGAMQKGYGVARIEGRSHLAHRASYAWANGDIPVGALLDHMCHNKSCVNPAHLRLADAILNGQNRFASNSNSKSGVRGVYWCNTYGHWIAKATINREPHHIGIFHDIDVAAQAVAQWRAENMPYSLMDKRKAI